MAFLLSVFPLFFSFPYFILFCIKFPTSLRAARRLVCFYFLNTTQNRNKFICLPQKDFSQFFIFIFTSIEIIAIFVTHSMFMFPLRMPPVLVRMFEQVVHVCIFEAGWGRYLHLSDGLFAWSPLNA